jgi:LysM repeat protein
MNLFKIIFIGFFFVNGYLFSQNSFINHKIEKGETLTQICNKYEVSSQEVLKLNPDAVSGLKEGSYLIIPKLAPTKKSVVKKESTVIEHIVEPKETLFGISKKFDITIDELLAANPILKEGLKEGQTIIIPSPKKATSNQEPTQTVKPKPTETNQNQSDFHLVKAGETKFSLAKKYGLTLAELEELNPEIKSGLPVDFKLIVKKEKGSQTAKASTKEEPKSTNVKSEPVKSEPAKPEPAKPEPIKSEKINAGKNQIVVQKGMTLYSIATENNLTVDEIIALNPFLKDGLKENDVITLPNAKKTTKKTDTKNKPIGTATKRIAILLPFNQIDKSKFEVDLSKDKFLNMVSDFYLGNKIAIDSAKTKKMKHQVTFFNSNETPISSDVENLVNTGKLNDFDVIIGCFYPNNTDQLVDLLKDKPVVIVSPIRHQTSSYPTLIETMVKKELLYSDMLEFFKKPENNLISIIDIKKISSSDFFSNQANISFFKFDDKSNFKSEELMNSLDIEKTNVLFFDSESLNFLTKINQLTKDLKTEGYKIELVSVDFNTAHESDEVFHDFVKNQLVYFSTYDNRDTQQTKIFDRNFRTKYKGMPNQFVYRGYDIAMDVFERATQNTSFISTFDTASKQLNTNFDYAKTPEKGFQNKAFFLFQFNSNFTLTRLK